MPSIDNNPNYPNSNRLAAAARRHAVRASITGKTWVLHYHNTTLTTANGLCYCLRGRPRLRIAGSGIWRSTLRWAGLSLSIDTTSSLPLYAIVNVLSLRTNTLKGPSYGGLSTLLRPRCTNTYSQVSSNLGMWGRSVPWHEVGVGTKLPIMLRKFLRC